MPRKSSTTANTKSATEANITHRMKLDWENFPTAGTMIKALQGFLTNIDSKGTFEMAVADSRGKYTVAQRFTEKGYPRVVRFYNTKKRVVEAKSMVSHDFPSCRPY